MGEPDAAEAGWELRPGHVLWDGRLGLGRGQGTHCIPTGQAEVQDPRWGLAWVSTFGLRLAS